MSRTLFAMFSYMYMTAKELKPLIGYNCSHEIQKEESGSGSAW
jgi:hypothetical protein